MAFNWILLLRVQQFLYAVIVLGLSAYVVNWYIMDTRSASPSQVNFLVAVPVMSLCSLSYTEGVSRFAPRYYKPVIAMGIDAFNALLYFSGFIALAVFLNGLLFCRGSVCGSARAATAFSAVSFGVWTASAILLALSVFKGGMGTKGGLGKSNQRTQAMYAAEMKDAAARA